MLGGRHGHVDWQHPLRDAQGCIHLVDRKRNMIISGGENNYPSEVESVLGGHPEVKDAAAVGVLHDK